MVKILPYLFFSFIFIFSCTSKKKYAELQKKNTHNEAQVVRLRDDSTRLSQKIDTLKKQVHTLSFKNIAPSEKETKKPTRLRAAEEHYKQISFFLYNIIKYVEWSASVPGDVFTIAIVGNDPLFKEIGAQFNGKKVGHRMIQIKRITSEKDICHADVYFVSHQKLHFLSKVYKATNNEKALVVSDHHQLTTGVHVSFFLEGDSLKFDLNEEEIKKSNIVMSSTLKSLQN
ncbi:MAG: YfiR family protein [Opitutaceae bacterium]|nr:YfiR family protein [Cytophagales bacterium]